MLLASIANASSGFVQTGTRLFRLGDIVENCWKCLKEIQGKSHAAFQSARSKLLSLLESAMKRLASQTWRELKRKNRQWLASVVVAKDTRRTETQVPKKRATLNLYTDDSVREVLDLHEDELPRVPNSAGAVTDIWSAARCCVAVLRESIDLRARFPHALSEGLEGGFARWVLDEGREALRLNDEACAFIRSAFEAGLGDRVRDLAVANLAKYPLGLVPAVQPQLLHSFFKKIRRERNKHGLRTEEVWWFALECAENPARQIVLTYLFTPNWQQLFPDGITRFGRHNFASWLQLTYGFDEPRIGPTLWPIDMTPAEEIRIAWRARAEWQRRFPDALSDRDGAKALLEWLSSPTAGLAEDVRDWCSELDFENVAVDLVTPGINVIGHFCVPSGLRTSVELITKGLSFCWVSSIAT